MGTGRFPGTEDSEPTCSSWGRKFESQLDQIVLVESDHEIISTVILPFLLTEEGQLSVTVKPV